MLRFFLNATRILTLLACLALAPVAILISNREESFARDWIVVAAPILSGILLLVWYFLLGWGPFQTRLKRCAKIAGGLALLLVAFVGLMRHEGSKDGGSLPRFVPRWTPHAETVTPPAPMESEISAGGKEQPSAAPLGSADSAQFLGPHRDGVWKDSAVSFDWTKHPPQELWRIQVGLGWSGFAVAGPRALTQEQRQERELVTCYDLATGRMLWSHGDDARLLASPPDGGGAMGGDGPRATPTVVGDRVYSYGATGILNCLDLSTGMTLWTVHVVEPPRVQRWGISCSPLYLEQERLIVVNAAENSAPTLVAYHAEDGSPVWTYEGTGASYSSPRLLEINGRKQIVSVNGSNVTGHDPATGRELWRFDWPGIYPKVAQPIAVGSDRLLVTASYGAGSHLLQITKAADGTSSATSLWKTTRLKTKFSSPAVLGELAFGIDEGTLTCVNLKDGSRVWKAGKFGFGQHLLVRDQLLIQAEDGRVVTVPASPTPPYENPPTLAALSSMTWNPPTLAGLYLLVRNDREAVCFRLGTSN